MNDKLNLKSDVFDKLDGANGLDLGHLTFRNLKLRPQHRSALINGFAILCAGMRTYDDFLSAAVYCRDRLNPNMFIYALSVAILHRPDTRNLEVPPLSEVFPDKYMDSAVFARAKEESNVVSSGSRVRIIYT
uniref:Hemocyanin N-terminal domain-containing protein n=1 Tax=Timema shepardi TaxID=629360 RepID=A0A7R9FWL1_TIMSH|nr:unnamed protein product [Timema shepardi]